MLLMNAASAAHADGPHLSATAGDVGKRWAVCAKDVTVRDSPGGRMIGTLYGPQQGRPAQSFTITGVAQGGQWVSGHAWGHVNKDGYLQNGWFCRENVPPTNEPASPAPSASTPAAGQPVAEASSSGPPRAVPAMASELARKFQPAYDYDKDGCYPTPAIGSNGAIASGLNPSGALNGNCRDRSDLDNTNGYARSACGNGWCAIMYALYFEKDQATVFGGGHRHDWEHVVVWVKNNRAMYVAASAHGEYKIRPSSQVRWQGSHPEIVYHKDGALTHAFRFASASDEPPENYYRRWQFPGLVGWNSFPPGIRDRLARADFGDAKLDLTDGRFTQNLAKAKPAGISFNPDA
ncbi:NPP1 family protein [Nonomuraea guangzhouensis]|uniref:NPP1 family protein n=2 Tax=Nonomuraea guangzhouensis TaxID=1291555 RepID=A0ABW4GU22_9ACTN